MLATVHLTTDFTMKKRNGEYEIGEGLQDDEDRSRVENDEKNVAIYVYPGYNSKNLGKLFGFYTAITGHARGKTRPATHLCPAS
jgi:hypothetical protein